jgi:hypothetical protein
MPAEPAGKVGHLVHPAAAPLLTVDLLHGQHIDVERLDRCGDSAEIDPAGSHVEPVQQVPARHSHCSRASMRSLTEAAPRYCTPLTKNVGVPRTPLRTPELKSASTRSSTNWVAGHTTFSGGTPISLA